MLRIFHFWNLEKNLVFHFLVEKWQLKFILLVIGNMFKMWLLRLLWSWIWWLDEMSKSTVETESIRESGHRNTQTATCSHFIDLCRSSEQFVRLHLSTASVLLWCSWNAKCLCTFLLLLSSSSPSFSTPFTLLYITKVKASHVHLLSGRNKSCPTNETSVKDSLTFSFTETQKKRSQTRNR